MKNPDTNESPNEALKGPPNVDVWSRDGFVGANAIGLRADYTPHYLSVEGPHAPKRINLFDIVALDSTQAEALPTLILSSRAGVKLSVSRRREAMPFTLRNTECDEVHFVQSGKVRYDTDFGFIDAGSCDLVCIPRSVSYRVTPTSDDLLLLIIESPSAFAFDTPAPFGMMNFDVSLRRAKVAPSSTNSSKPHTLLLKSEDGITRYIKPSDPIAALAQVGGVPPVWALNLSDIQPVSYGGLGGPPAQFLSSRDSIAMLFSLSARAASLRPPIHHNADFDELILYARGPGAWGGVNEPGTLCHTPKGVTHHGPSENVAEGYQALLIETKATLRFTKEAGRCAHLVETDQYAIHPFDGNYQGSKSSRNNGSDT